MEYTKLFIGHFILILAQVYDSDIGENEKDLLWLRLEPSVSEVIITIKQKIVWTLTCLQRNRTD